MSRYELLERIGAGGMAEIFRGKAIAAGGFEKPVAIKRILPHLSQDQRFVELLMGEAKILANLRHRNIVQIYDVGLADDGQYFLVMEYVDGTDVGELFEYLEKEKRRVPLDVALHLAAEVCEALDHAHRATDEDGRLIRLVHRDVSPSNILLSVSGEVKLTDFGIAKSIEEATGHGGVRGKFAYISPEQARNVHVDGRSDAYSLGIVLYELITGTRLYSGLADFDALTAVRSPRVVHLRKARADVPEELDRIVARALDPNPDQRYKTAAELGNALRGFRYSMDETSGDPAKAISNLVKDVWRDVAFDDDERTVMREIPRRPSKSMQAPVIPFEDEETRAISLLADDKRSFTLST
ncbi:MAG: serine/threonine protein kinase, partial [Deltaproteobacteria bacterium]|nr:serine/threonine protein kinase [Deltaproteobacteria bacterium]